MKNRFFKITGLSSLSICLLLLTGGLTGCGEELLDKFPNSAISEASFYKTEAHAIGAVNAVYAQLHGAYDPWVKMGLDIWSDDCEKGGGGPADNAQYQQFHEHNILLTNGEIGRHWGQFYTGIFRANKAIENIPDIDTPIKDRLIAEAKFLRALYYYNLNKKFNGVPLVTSTATEDYTKILRSTPREIWDFIVDDLLEAVATLPDSYPNNADLGRATKGSARGLLGRVYLFMQEWQKAADVYSDIIRSQNYRLMDNYADNFLSAEGDNLPESLFEVQFAAGTGSDAQSFRWHGWVRPRDVNNIISWGGNGFCLPTQSLVDAFEPGDVRRKATVMVEGDEVFGVIYGSGEHDYAVGWSYTGFNVRKYIWGPEVIHQEADGNFKIIRYSDVLLGYAEAVYRGATGNAGISGLEALNMVRRRAELGDIPALTFEAIVQERRVEFAFECIRFFDVVRWGIAKDVFAPTFRENHSEYLPIPLGEILINPGLRQNPGYEGYVPD